MDETEALCTNIGVMVNGELKCYGSLQHLKSRYGDGYTLLAKITSGKNQLNSDEKIKKFINFILISFKNSELKENRDGFINMHIQNNPLTTLSTIFAIIENNKAKYSVEYYVVTQTKLEQIFLNFAEKQVDCESRRITKRNIFSKCCVWFLLIFFFCFFLNLTKYHKISNHFIFKNFTKFFWKTWFFFLKFIFGGSYKCK